MLYGSIMYLILNILLGNPEKKEVNGHPTDSVLNNNYFMSPAFSQKVFLRYKLISRECHVALKLLETFQIKK